MSNGVTQNPGFVNGASCPANVDGNKTITDNVKAENIDASGGDKDGICERGEACFTNTYLMNAIEVVGDYIGDDDGLCESNESCIYAPNYGVYQGTGDYTAQTCVFSDGTVSGVTMYAYSSN